MNEVEKGFMDVYQEYMKKYSKKLGKEEARKRAILLIKAIKQVEDDLNSGKIVIPD